MVSLAYLQAVSVSLRASWVSYYKCSKVQSENVQKLMNQYGAQAAGKFMGGSIVAAFT